MTAEIDLSLLLVSSLAAYACGSIPTGVLIARRRGVAVQDAGSGNVGATNVARTAGKRAGILTLVGDVLKGVLPVLVVRWLALGDVILAATAVAALVGHVFSVFLKFSGGKGVATGLGVILGLTPLAVGTALVGFGLVFAATRLVSLASIVAAALTPVLIYLFAYSCSALVAGSLIAGLIILRHHENIRRLIRGEEQPFRTGTSPPPA